MAQLVPPKSSVAWFKLAECISRREKERALGMYRLLVHSLPDDAVAAQLEGDILYSFGDERAVDAYVKAASLYEKKDKLLQAATVYERIVLIKPQRIDYYTHLLRFYEQLHNTSKVVQTARALISLFIEQNKYMHAHELVNEINLSLAEKAPLYEEFVLLLLQSTIPFDRNILNMNITYAVDGYIATDSMALSRFLSKLSGFDQKAYTYACDYVRSHQ